METKVNFFEDNPDIRFHMEKRVDWKRLFDWTSAQDRENMGVTSPEEFRNLWTGMLTTAGEFAGSQVAPVAAEVEREGVKIVNGEIQFSQTLTQNIEAVKQMGVPALTVPTRYGGLGGPFIVEGISAEMFGRACPSMFLNIAWWGPIALVVDEFAPQHLKDIVLPKIATGEWSGSMALTEPGAGSDLGEIRTYAEKQADGTWKVYGTKLFISNGNAEVCLMLAQNARGVKGLDSLNLYLVFRHEDGKPNFELGKLEEKIGLHQSATCELRFNGSKAYLIGEDGKGFRHMLHLMNDMRMGVGFQGLAYMEAIYRTAVTYARQRKTMGKAIERHELLAEKLLDMHVELAALRSLVYRAGAMRSLTIVGERYVNEGDPKDAPDVAAAKRAEIKKLQRKSARQIRDWTPLLKFWAGEKGFRMAQQGLQIHGGYGYSTEYRAEAWVRESLILSIYEGTSQIQALMCVKDTMKDVVKNPLGFLMGSMATSMKALFSCGCSLEGKLVKSRRLLNKGILSVMWQLIKLNGNPVSFRKFGPALLHAERLCWMKCYVAMGESLVKDAAVDASRAWIAERFLTHGLGVMKGHLAEIGACDRVIARHIEGDGVLKAEWEKMGL